MTPTDHEFVVFFIIMVGLLETTNLLINIINSFRRRSPLEAVFVTKEELNARLTALSAKVDRHAQQQHDDITDLNKRIDGVFGEVRELGGMMKRGK